MPDSRARRELERAVEEERRRLARELHDETLQGLAALRVSLSWALQHGDNEDLADAASGAVDALAAEIASLRRLVARLRPAALDDLGLRDALETLAAGHRSGSLAVRTDLQLGGERLDPELESAVYRIAQEALTNADRHAGARNVLVRVWSRKGRLQIEVRDDGCGFDPGVTNGGFGLAGIRERVQLAGGTVKVEAAPGRGTSVRALLPLPIIRTA